MPCKIKCPGTKMGSRTGWSTKTGSGISKGRRELKDSPWRRRGHQGVDNFGLDADCDSDKTLHHGLSDTLRMEEHRR